MDKDRCEMVNRILNLTLEIIYLLTGKEYTEVKTSSECVTPISHAPESGGWGETQSPIMEPPPNSLINDKNNEQKILKLTNKIIELLSGEVPIRCQDVTVHFSMEEWEYVEGHKDLYKDIMTENHKPLTSPDGSGKQNRPTTCPSPLYSQDCPEEKQIHQGKDLTDIKVEGIVGEGETCVSRDHQCKEEEIPTDISPADDCTKGSGGRLLTSQDSEGMFVDNVQDNSGEESIPPKPPSVPHSRDPSSDSNQPSVAQSQSVKQIPCPKEGEKIGNCKKKLKSKSHLSTHKIDEGPFSCPECGKSFTRKLQLVDHLRTHTRERPFSCLECSKCFMQKSHLFQHQKIHTGEKPFSCLECGKCFTLKYGLAEHRKIHTEEKPFLCLECGKSFKHKSYLVQHQRMHTGQNLFSCQECGKRFTQKKGLLEHARVHTGEKPFPCLECGKFYTTKSNLLKHQKRHKTEK